MIFNQIQQKIVLPTRSISFSLLVLLSIVVNDLNAATVLVSEAGEAGSNCTLRQAVAWINTPADPPPVGCNSTGPGFGTDDQIDFSVAIVTLSNGQLDINKDITINGGVNGVTIEGGGSNRILNLDEANTTITLNKLTLSGGSASEGAAIYASNVDLFINDSRISGNHASSLGGAIYAQTFSHVSIDQSEISNNSARNGGAIYAKTNSTIDLTETLITKNDANFSTFDGKGGGIYLDLANLFVVNSTISNNSAGLDGGGIVAFNNSVIEFTNSTLSSNKALSGAGISVLSNVETTFTNSTISSNKARNTSASNGGGGTGGGIDIYTSSTVTLNNSTISGNLADSSGGGIQVNGGALVLNNSTLSENRNRSTAGGLHVVNGSTVILKNSILANSHTLQGDNAVDCKMYGNPSSVTADEHNIIEFDDCNTLALNLNAELGALASNGGPTKTHGLYAQSPAVDHADDTICADVATINNLDQRGIVRPEGQHCDIGSFEGTIARPNSFYIIPAKNGKTVIFNL